MSISVCPYKLANHLDYERLT